MPQSNSDEHRSTIGAGPNRTLTSAQEETEAIRLHLQRQHLYSLNLFRRATEAQLGRALGPGRPGRPRTIPESASEPGEQEYNKIAL